MELKAHQKIKNLEEVTEQLDDLETKVRDFHNRLSKVEKELAKDVAVSTPIKKWTTWRKL